MQRDDLSDLVVFLAVADARSFTRAAVQIGISQSAVSQNVRRLEEKVGLKLLSRTTRSVGLTEAGEQLRATLAPALAEINAQLDALNQLRSRPAGTVRITCSRHAAETVLWPAVDAVMAQHPEILVELSLDAAFADLAADRLDAGVRLGEQVDKDMIAMRIGPDLRMQVVGSPAYFTSRNTPRHPRELTAHRCINIRMATRGDLYIWEFEKDGHALNVRVDGQFVINDADMALRAALAGHGLAYLLSDRIEQHCKAGDLIPVLEEWCPPFAGHHLYYSGRRNLSPAFKVVIEELRRRAASQTP